MFCTSSVSSLYTEANEAPLEERRLKLAMHYYLKTRACIDNPAHHALHEFDGTTRNLYVPSHGCHGLYRDQSQIGLPLIAHSFPPGTPDCDPKGHSLIDRVSKCMITRQEAHAKFNEYRETQGSHYEVYTDGSKMNEGVGQRKSSTAISRVGRQPATTCPKDCQTTAPSLLLGLPTSLWHWTIPGTWAQFTTM